MRLLGRPRNRWEDDDKWLLQRRYGGRGLDCVYLAQYRDMMRAVVNKATNRLVVYSAGNFSISWGTVSVAQRTLLSEVCQSVG